MVHPDLYRMAIHLAVADHYFDDDGILLTCFVDHNYLREKLLGAGLMVGFSFLVPPVNELQDFRYNNNDVYAIAEVFKEKKISGNFFLHYKSFGPSGKTVVLSYLTNSKLFG